MILSPPLPWGLVPAGAVVLIDGVPRTVLAAAHGTGLSTIFLEGLPPRTVDPASYTQLVSLDDTDAIAAFAAAGLNPEVIDT